MYTLSIIEFFFILLYNLLGDFMTDITFIANLFKATFNLIPTNITELNTSGTMNMVYLLEFNNRKLIIRLRENDAYAENEFMKEKWFSNQCTKIGIPVPRIMHTGKYCNVDFLIEDYIDGISGNKYEKKDFVFEKLGMYSRKIKKIPISGYGVEISDFTKNIFTDDFYDSPQEQISKNIEALTSTDKLISLKVYEPKYTNYIKKSFSHLISQDSTCVLNHGDISLNNTIISHDNVVYWIDFGSVNANLLYSEFANLKAENNDDLVAFSRGFGLPITEIRKNLDTYKLLSSFDKLRWSLTTGNSEYISWYCENAKKSYQLFISNIIDQER